MLLTKDRRAAVLQGAAARASRSAALVDRDLSGDTSHPTDTVLRELAGLRSELYAVESLLREAEQRQRAAGMMRTGRDERGRRKREREVR